MTVEARCDMTGDVGVAHGVGRERDQVRLRSGIRRHDGGIVVASRPSSRLTESARGQEPREARGEV